MASLIALGTKRLCGGRPFAPGAMPDGQIGFGLSSPVCKNIPVRALPKSTLELPPSRPTQRGVSRSSRTLGTGGDGRGSIRLATASSTNDVDADGEVVWS